MVTEKQIRLALNDPASNDPPDELVYPRNWDQDCQAFVWQLCRLFGRVATTYRTADIARAASGPLNRNAAAAPPGAIHFWYENHVALGLGGERVCMASFNIDTPWVPNKSAGETTVARYSAKTGLTYAGWADSEGHGLVSIQIISAASSTDSTTPITRRKTTMLPIKIIDGKKKLGGGTRTYLFGPGLFLETTGMPTANAVSVILIGSAETPNATYQELAIYAKASGACDPALLAKIEAAAKA